MKKMVFCLLLLAACVGGKEVPPDEAPDSGADDDAAAAADAAEEPAVRRNCYRSGERVGRYPCDRPGAWYWYENDAGAPKDCFAYPCIPGSHCLPDNGTGVCR